MSAENFSSTSPAPLAPPTPLNIMAIDSDIRDQAYQFFIQEASELLQVIETELLTLKTERSQQKVHNLMRAAHSIKGGSACVGLETIKTLAHRLEDIFKALHHEELEIDDQLESLLLQAYDCLRLPLSQEITVGYFNAEQAISIAEPVFAQIEAQLGDFLAGEYPLFNSFELEVDIVLNIFEVDVSQELDRLTNVLAHPEDNEVVGELRATADVLIGIGELLNLPGLCVLAQTSIAALDAHPNQALHIAQLALADFKAAQQAVIAGDRTQGGSASASLAALAASPRENQTGETSDDLFVQDETVATNEALSSIPYLDEIFGLSGANSQTPEWTDLFEVEALNSELSAADASSEIVVSDGGRFLEEPVIPELASLSVPSLQEVDVSHLLPSVAPGTSDSIQKSVQSIEQVFENLPLVAEDWGQGDSSLSKAAPLELVTRQHGTRRQGERLTESAQEKQEDIATNTTSYLSVTVDLERLERMNNLVGELTINRNSLSLQNEQMQGTVQELLHRFERFQKMANHLRSLSDQILVTPHRHPILQELHTFAAQKAEENLGISSPDFPISQSSHLSLFDSLEMDSYGELHSLLQDTLEEMVQLEEIVGDVALLAGQSSQTLEGQRQMIGHLRDDLMWARMLPLSKILSRFPRTLRDLSTTYQKPVELKLSGTGVLVDKAALEKLYDPLLHLLRNAFDHGIELPEIRRQFFKPERGQIEIRAYHQGSQTVIEVGDDGQGIHLEHIRFRALELGWLSSEQLAAMSTNQLLGLLFEPGFSTATQVSELSGRGVGLDVVRTQLRSLKGTVTVTTTPGQGTTFTLRIPLTLTIAKLLVCLVGMSAYALPADSIEEILIPKADQVKRSGRQRFLHWREQILPVYHLSELLEYAVPLPESIQSLALVAAPSPEDWALPMLIIHQDDQFLALEVDRLVTEQELVIKPFGAAIAPPSYIYGCTILGDGSLIPVIDGAALIDQMREQGKGANTTLSELTSKPKASIITANPLVLIVDDSIALRQTLALTLQKAGYRVLQARDGREAIDQLQQNSHIQIVVCDIEMPNLNGFEFLTHRRQNSLLSKIPVVMLTSRSSEKHQRLATQLGASAYFTKPYLDQEFLASIKTILEQTGT